MAKKTNEPSLKVLLSIGGPGSGGHFAQLRTLADIDRFADTLMRYLQENNLDGVDIAWFYPTRQHKRQFILVLEVSAVYVDGVDKVIINRPFTTCTHLSCSCNHASF